MKKMIYSFLIIISLAVVVNAQVDYEAEIQPIFNSSCTNCHGNSGGLSLSSYSNLMSNNVIVAGDHAASELYNRITLPETAAGDMPPAGSLSQSEIDLIAQWIGEGALEVPAVDNENLFFSEYIEGSSNNKVLEIYNPTGSTVDLSEYKVQQSNNGAGWGIDDGPPPVVEPGFTLQLSGTLASGEVYILSADAAAGVFLAQADESLSYPSVCHYNGDDAVGLFHNDVLIDVRKALRAITQIPFRQSEPYKVTIIF